MIDVVFVRNVDNWKKGDVVRLADDSPLARSGYVKVVRRDEVAPSPDVDTRRAAPGNRRVARRRTKEVTDGQGGAESGSGSTFGADGGSQSGRNSGGAVASADEADGTSQSGASARFGEGA